MALSIKVKPVLTKKDLRNDIEAELRRLMEVWFPKTIDRVHGGFLCDFDYSWQPSGAQPKMLECQARQTFAAALAAARFPDLAFLREVAAHGFSCLKTKMWDRELGGWYRMLDRSGRPLEGSTKHGHSTGYAISACVACYELTGDPDCLVLARNAFVWWDDHCHDNEHGGYFGFCARDGTPIVSPAQAPAPHQTRDSIGTPIGLKDANTTSDLLKSFADLYRIWPDALLKKRLEELVSIVRDRLVVPPGVMHMFAHADWTTVPDLARYGQIIRSANHLISATGHVAEQTTRRVAKSMIDTMLQIAWDRHTSYRNCKRCRRTFHRRPYPG